MGLSIKVRAQVSVTIAGRVEIKGIIKATKAS